MLNQGSHFWYRVFTNSSLKIFFINLSFGNNYFILHTRNNSQYSSWWKQYWVWIWNGSYFLLRYARYPSEFTASTIQEKLFWCFQKRKVRKQSKIRKWFRWAKQNQKMITNLHNYVNNLVKFHFFKCEVFSNKTMVKYRTNSARRQWIIKEYSLFKVIVLKNFSKHLICIRSLIEQGS